MVRLRTISIFIAATVLLLSLTVYAQNPKKTGDAVAAPVKPGIDTSMTRHPYGFHLQQILVRINATPPQQQQIAAVVEAHRPKIEPLREEYRQKSEEFITLICTGKPAEIVMSRQTQLNQIHNEITNEYCLMRIEIRRLLQPEQWGLFQDYSRQQGWTTGNK